MTGSGPRPVDWAAVRQRLADVHRAIEESDTLTPERAGHLLAQRARALARVPLPRPQDELEVVTFPLAREQYAVESRFVTAVFRVETFSALPGAEPPVRGVTAWRGGLLVVLDLRSTLGLSAAALDDLSHVVVLGTRRPAFGLLTDGTGTLRRFAASELRPPVARPSGEYLRGVTGDALVVLDAQALLRDHA